MQRQPRRLTPTPRTYRHTRVPAYKVRRAARPSDPQDDLRVDAIVEPVEVIEPPAIEGDPPQVDGIPIEENGTAPVEEQAEALALGPGTMPLGADGDAPAVDLDPHEATADLDFAGYLQSIEAAAARSRAELRGRAIPRMRPQAAYTAPEPLPAAAIAVEEPVPALAAGDVPPPSVPRGRRGRQRPEDPRPRLKRPKTWFFIAAMIPLIAGIGVLIYIANLAKTTYDAYNDIHVDPTPRTHFQVNPEGTPEVVPTEQVAASLPDWDKKDEVNILLLGIDPRPDEIEPPRSDTIIVVHIDPADDTVTTMSVPRDLYVTIPGFGDDKINAAYPLGETNLDLVPGGGPALVAQTIEYNFDIPIHYYATVDFDGFRKIIDTIGGIVIDVPAPVKDDQYPTETYGLTRVYFHTGLQKMDGETALRYARTRHGDNDISRGDRQQQVLQAIRAQSISLGLITRAADLIGEVGDSVRTDLNFNQMLALANLGRKIDSNNVKTVNLWELGLLSEHDPESEDDPFYFEADWSGVLAVMADTFAVEPPPTPTPEATPTPTETPTAEPSATAAGAASTETREAASTATADARATRTPASPTTPVPGPGVDLALPVVVQNSSGIAGLATTGVAVLQEAGFSEVYPDASDEPLPETVIYDNVGSPDTALYVAQLLGLPSSVIQPANGGTAILVVLGEDAPLDVLQP